MRAKIILNQPLTQERYGLHFEKGEAFTDDEYIIKKLKAKGVKVEEIKEEKPMEKMTNDELLAIAKEKGLEIPAKTVKKDIIAYITGEKEIPQTDTTPDGNNNPAEDSNPENPNGEPGDNNPGDTTPDGNQ